MPRHHRITASVAALTTLTLGMAIAAPAQAENLEDVQRLMNTRQCQGCELSNAGFVHSNLQSVDLQNANLILANLNRANLSNANLRGANLTNAVLSNANLTGADLQGANLTGADLREAYLVGANLEGANLEGANLLGVVGLPEQFLTVDNLYQWGLVENQRGNFRGAIGYYDRALAVQPDFANAVLARGVAYYRLGQFDRAVADANLSQQLYTTQNNVAGQEASMRLTAMVDAYLQASSTELSEGRPNFLNFISSLSTLVLRYLLR